MASIESNDMRKKIFNVKSEFCNETYQKLIVKAINAWQNGRFFERHY